MNTIKLKHIIITLITILTISCGLEETANVANLVTAKSTPPYFATTVVSCERLYQEKLICVNYSINNENDQNTVKQNCQTDDEFNSIYAGEFHTSACNQDIYSYSCPNLEANALQTNDYYAQSNSSGNCTRGFQNNQPNPGIIPSNNGNNGSNNSSRELILSLATPTKFTLADQDNSITYTLTATENTEYIIGVVPPTNGIYTIQIKNPNNIKIAENIETGTGYKVVSFVSDSSGKFSIQVNKISGSGVSTITANKNELLLTINKDSKIGTANSIFVDGGINRIGYRINPILQYYGYEIELVYNKGESNENDFSVEIKTVGNSSNTNITTTSASEDFGNIRTKKYYFFALLSSTSNYIKPSDINPNYIATVVKNTGSGTYNISIKEGILASHGDEITGSFTNVSEKHYYNLKISKENLKKYTLKISTTNSSDRITTTITPDGSTLSKLNPSTNNYNIAINDTLNSNLYKLAIGQKLSTSANYTLRLEIEEIPTVTTNLSGTCNAPKINCFEINKNTANETFWYKIFLNKDIYTFNMQKQGGNANYTFALYKATGDSSPIITDNIGTKSNRNFFVDMNINYSGYPNGYPEGFYYLKVFSTTANTDTSVTPKIILSAIPAQELSVGTPITNTLATSGAESIFYTFRIDYDNKDVNYRLKLGNSSNSDTDFTDGSQLDMFLYTIKNGIRSQLGKSENLGSAKESISYKAGTSITQAQPGVYYIEIKKPSSSQSVGYKLEALSGTSTVISLVNGSATTTHRWGTINNENTSDTTLDGEQWYDITLPGNKTYIFSLTVPSAYNSLANYDLAVFNSDNALLSSPSLGEKQNETIVYTTPSTLTTNYKIRVTNTNFINGDFTLNVREVDRNTNTLVENNKTFTANHNFGSNEIDQWYKVNLTSNMLYSVSLKSTDSQNIANTQNFNLAIYPVSTNCNTYGCVRYISLQDFKKRTSGLTLSDINYLTSENSGTDYLIRVIRTSGTGNYTFKVNQPGYTTFASITDTTGRSENLTIQKSNPPTSTWYSVNLNENNLYNFYLTVPGGDGNTVRGDDHDLYVYDASYNLLAFSSNDTPGKHENVLYRTIQTGTYLVEIKTRSTSFLPSEDSHVITLRIRLQENPVPLDWNSIKNNIHGANGNLDCSPDSTVRNVTYQLDVPSDIENGYFDFATIPASGVELKLYYDNDTSHLIDTKQRSPINYKNPDKVTWNTESWYARNSYMNPSAKGAFLNEDGLSIFNFGFYQKEDAPYRMDVRVFKFEFKTLRNQKAIASTNPVKLKVQFYCTNTYNRYQGTDTQTEWTYDNRSIPTYMLRWYGNNNPLKVRDKLSNAYLNVSNLETKTHIHSCLWIGFEAQYGCKPHIGVAGKKSYDTIDRR